MAPEALEEGAQEIAGCVGGMKGVTRGDGKQGLADLDDGVAVIVVFCAQAPGELAQLGARRGGEERQQDGLFLAMGARQQVNDFSG
jgi:hypothetical protein